MRSAGEVSVLGADPAHGGEAWRARTGVVLQSWRDHRAGCHHRAERAAQDPAADPARPGHRRSGRHRRGAAGRRQEKGSHDDQADQFRPRATIRFSVQPGQRAQRHLYISGMPALDSDGNFVPGTFDEEADHAWAAVLAIAAAAGYSADDLLYVQVLLADIGNYAAINSWWRRQFPDPATAPARLTYQAGALPFGAKIELQAVAARSR